MTTPRRRVDFDILQGWVPRGSRVLDLGCGDGALLKHLQQTKDVVGLGVEINPQDIARCLSKGIDVIEHDLDDGLGRFRDDNFDMVVMAYTLQAVKFPAQLLNEMLRVGKESVVTLPNFGYWRMRASLLFKGQMPRTKLIPQNWHDTHNLHLCTLRDFEELCAKNAMQIRDLVTLDEKGAIKPWRGLRANWLSASLVCRLTRG